MRIKIGDKVYSLDALEQVTLRDVLSFDGQAEDMRLGCTWDDITAMADMDESAMTERQQLVMFGVTAWAAQRVAGENVTLDQALDHPLSAYQVIPDPEDRKGGSRPPTKGQKARKPKKATAPRATAAAADTAETSPADPSQG